jgi:hypothetical protein
VPNGGPRRRQVCSKVPRSAGKPLVVPNHKWSLSPTASIEEANSVIPRPSSLDGLSAAVLISLRGVAMKTISWKPQGPSLFPDNGGELLVCPICVKSRKISEEFVDPTLASQAPPLCGNGSVRTRRASSATRPPPPQPPRRPGVASGGSSANFPAARVLHDPSRELSRPAGARARLS